MNLDVATATSGFVPVSTSSTDGPQAAIDAAISRIDAISQAILGLQQALATIQDAIAILQQERASLVAPNPSDFYETEQRKVGTPPNEKTETVRALDKGAFDAAMSRYLHELARIDSEIQAKQNELALKEGELAGKETELAAAEHDLATAQRQLEEALQNDAAKLQKAQEEFRKQQERIRDLHEQALRAQAEAQKAQELLQKGHEEIQKVAAGAAELAGVKPEDQAEFWEKVAAWDGKSVSPFAVQEPIDDQRLQTQYVTEKLADQGLRADLQGAANCLPQIKDGKLLPAATQLSARDFIEVAPEVASFEVGVFAPDSGLLIGYDEDAPGKVSPELAMQMYRAWGLAGFSADDMQLAMQGITGAPQFRFDPGDLYGPLGTPEAIDIQQDSIGDCYFVASLAAMADQQPGRIEDMIEYDPYKGEFEVTLHKREWQWLPPGFETKEVTITVTQSDMEDNLARRGGSTVDNNGGDSPIWPAVLETAYAKLNDKKWSNGLDQGYGKIDGGKARDAMFALTGSKGDDVKPDNDRSAADDAAHMYDEIDKALDEGRPVTLSTDPEHRKQPGDGLADNHVYMVERIYKDQDGKVMVEVRNPWGHNNNVGEGHDTPNPTMILELETLVETGGLEYFNIGPKL